MVVSRKNSHNDEQVNVTMWWWEAKVSDGSPNRLDRDWDEDLPVYLYSTIIEPVP